MFIHHRTKGFVLKENERGEADKVFLVFTEDFGQIEVLAKGVRKIKSKLRGNIPLFSISEIEFVQGSVYKTLTDASLIDDFESIGKDLKKAEITSQIAETFTQLIKGEEKDLKIWSLLKETFETLNNSVLASTHRWLIFYYFLWRFFSILGYQPELYQCSFCREELRPEELYFSFRGGALCPVCSQKQKEVIEVNVNTIKILREILKRNLIGFLKIKIGEKDQKNLKTISDFYVSFILPS